MSGEVGMAEGRPWQPPRAPSSPGQSTRTALTLQLLRLHLPKAVLAQRPGHFFTLAPPQGVLAGTQRVADVGIGDEHSQLGVRQWHQACLQGPGMELGWEMTRPSACLSCPAVGMFQQEAPDYEAGGNQESPSPAVDEQGVVLLRQQCDKLVHDATGHPREAVFSPLTHLGSGSCCPRVCGTR